MTNKFFSPALQQDVLLDKEASDFYLFFFRQKHSLQSKDPKDYIGLDSLGYKFSEHGSMMNSAYAPKVSQITLFQVPPLMADYAREYLQSLAVYYPSDRLKAALPDVDVEDAKALEEQGLNRDLAIIVAKFPQQEQRMRDVQDHGIWGEPEIIDADHDVATLTRLHRKSGPKDLARIIKYLDEGFTETELAKFGFLVPYLYTPEELRAAKLPPAPVKSLLNIFLPAIMQNNSMFSTGHFTPSLEQLKTLINVGVKNGKQYKEIGVLLGRKPIDGRLMDEIPVLLEAMTLRDAETLYERTGALRLPEVVAIAGFLEAGHSLDEYFDILDALNPETEEGMLLAISPAYNVLRLVQNGMSVADIAKESAEGIPVYEM